MLKNFGKNLVLMSINLLILLFWLNTLIYPFMPYPNIQPFPTI